MPEIHNNFTEKLTRQPKKVSSSSDLASQNADVVEIDPGEYDYLVEEYTEKDLSGLFLAYGIDLNAYDDGNETTNTNGIECRRIVAPQWYKA